MDYSSKSKKELIKKLTESEERIAELEAVGKKAGKSPVVNSSKPVNENDQILPNKIVYELLVESLGEAGIGVDIVDKDYKSNLLRIFKAFL